MLTGLPIGLPFNRNLGGWQPTDASANTLQWLHDIDTAGSPWLKDKSQSGDDRILSGGPGLQRGQALLLNGSNQYGTVDDVAGLRPGTSSFSISVWVKATSTGTTSWIASKATGGTAGTSVGWNLYMGTAGTKFTWMVTESGQHSTATLTGTVTAGTWYHVVGTYDGSVARLYVDATLNHTGSTAAGIDCNNTTDLQIGAVGGSSPWPGELFDFRYYIAKALDADEVTWLYRHGKAGEDPGIAATELWLKLDEQNSASAMDSSGTGRHGRLLNTPSWATQDIYSFQNSNGYGIATWFDGTNDCIEPASHIDIFNTEASSATVACWVNPDALATDCVFRMQGGSQYVHLIQHGASWKLSLSNGTFKQIVGNAVVTGEWIHLACVKSGTTWTLYENGVSTGTVEAAAGAFTLTSTFLFQSISSTERFGGAARDMRFYNAALTADNITHLATYGASGTDAGTGNLLNHYPLTGDYLDAAGSNDATAVGAPETHYIPRDESDSTRDVLGETLAYSGSAPRHAKLIKSNCISLDGTNDYLVTNAFTLGITTAGSLTAWVKTTDTVGTPVSITAAGGAEELAIYMGLANAGKVSCLCQTSTGNYSYRESDTAINDGEWHHVAVVMDGGSAVGNLKVYIDGVEETGTTGTAGTPADLTDASRYMYVGTRIVPTASEYLAGNVCGARVYSAALTAAEVLGIYQGTSADPGATNCEGEWPLAEGSGTTSYDVTANDRDMTHFQGPTWAADNDVLAWNVGFGFRESGAVKIPGLRAGGTAADGNAFTHPAVDGHNGAESHINFNPYTIPALDSGNTDGYTVPTDWDVFEDDFKTPAQHWALRVDQETDFSEFFLYDDELTGGDWDNAHAYVKTVSQINAILEHLWTMDALTGSAPQSTEDEINSLSLDGGSMDAESTTTPAQRGNAIEIIDTGGSGDATLSATAPANLNLNKPVTFFGWFKLVAAPSGTDCMIADQNASSFRLEVNHTTNYLEWTYNGQTITDNVALNDSAFHFFACARDADGNLTLWCDGRWVGKQTGVTMPNATGTLAFGADGDMGGATVHYDEVGATDTNKLRDNHVGFLAAGKYLNKTTNEFEA